MFRDRVIRLALPAAIAASMGIALAANAESVSYDFTGTVTTATGIYSSAGSAVTGTITIDFSAANPLLSSGTVGNMSSGWSAGTEGGTIYGLPSPAGLVFGWTLASGGLSLASSISSDGTTNSVSGSPFGSPNWQANDIENSNAGTYVAAGISLSDTMGTVAPYDSNGLPIFSNATLASGRWDYLVGGVNQGIFLYTMTSMTPVPAPASAWLLLSGLSGLGALARRKRGVRIQRTF